MITLLLAEAVPASSSADLAKLTAAPPTLPSPQPAPPKAATAPDPKAPAANAEATPDNPLVTFVANPPVAAKPAPAPAPKTVTASPTPAEPSATIGAAAALATMQAQYLGHTPIGPLLVACINAFDTTRGDSQNTTHNDLLVHFCPSFLEELGKAYIVNIAKPTAAPARPAR